MVNMDCGHWAMADIVDFCKHGTAGHTGMMAERYADRDVLNVFKWYNERTVAFLPANRVIVEVYYMDGEHEETQIHVMQ